MKKYSELTFGFIISHPFHFRFYEKLINSFENPIVFIDVREDTPFEFSDDFLEKLNCPYYFVKGKAIKRVGRTVDFMFCMTPKHLTYNLSPARVITMQYGMAKEDYNYGLWRSRADLNLMFGDYSHDMIRSFAISRAVGNLSLQDFHGSNKEAQHDWLYLPTYGELSSLSSFVRALSFSKVKPLIRVKLHHASEFEDAEHKEILETYSNIEIIDPDVNTIEEIEKSKVIISDYSGAIFDSIYLDKKLVLFQPPAKQKIVRSSRFSIENFKANELGTAIETPQELAQLLDGQIAIKDIAVDKSLYFSNQGSELKHILKVLDEYIKGDNLPTATQMSSRVTYLRYLKLNTGEVRKALKLKRLISRAIAFSKIGRLKRVFTSFKFWK